MVMDVLLISAVDSPFIASFTISFTESISLISILGKPRQAKHLTQKLEQHTALPMQNPIKLDWS